MADESPAKRPEPGTRVRVKLPGSTQTAEGLVLEPQNCEPDSFTVRFQQRWRKFTEWNIPLTDLR